ncbi:conserved hypothetical protein [Paraburkholderia tropica]|uniref:DUF971 domain-containing protein n=1 Tax=Paraburkholderia tropica TaxID=92647 RepID=UPI001CAC171B|nr:DUF971 domain-containing protein [Paraburkholderia tropica]CAG9222145.1 conserved hypothetical protein [Paraburkholderia tropica]
MNTPLEVRNAPDALSLVWPSGETQRFAHADLRRACPCAACRSARLGGNTLEIAEAIRVREIAPMGYGVQLVFSDGHDRGIFPWRWFEQFDARR